MPGWRGGDAFDATFAGTVFPEAAFDGMMRSGSAEARGFVLRSSSWSVVRGVSLSDGGVVITVRKGAGPVPPVPESSRPIGRATGAGETSGWQACPN